MHKRPWIDVGGASAVDIARVIDTCPSGALGYELLGSSKREEPEQKCVVVRVSENGPYVVSGECRLVASGGKELAKGGNLVLCRCGRSSAMPFCDGTHHRVGFKDTSPG